jgi:translation initiation factor IF-3
VGVVSSEEARKRAYEAGLDLVEIASNTQPPVVRIMDYGKYKYEVEKKKKDAKKNQHIIKLKEIRYSPNISDHDYSYRMKQAREFIKDGNKVKAVVIFHGREMTHLDRGKSILEKMCEDLKDIATAEKKCLLEGRNLISTFIPSSAIHGAK